MLGTQWHQGGLTRRPAGTEDNGPVSDGTSGQPEWRDEADPTSHRFLFCTTGPAGTSLPKSTQSWCAGQHGGSAPRPPTTTNGVRLSARGSPGKGSRASTRVCTCHRQELTLEGPGPAVLRRAPSPGRSRTGCSRGGRSPDTGPLGGWAVTRKDARGGTLLQDSGTAGLPWDALTRLSDVLTPPPAAWRPAGP